MKRLCIILLVITVIMNLLCYYKSYQSTRDNYKGDYQDRAPSRPKVKLFPKIKKGNK